MTGNGTFPGIVGSHLPRKYWWSSSAVPVALRTDAGADLARAAAV